MTKSELKDFDDSLTVTDNRSGMTYTFPLHSKNFLRSEELAKIKDKDGEPLRSYDPGYTNTINCTSSICYIDGDKGILEY